jgi:thiol-disulfide isomerase/thioredoxin
MPRFAFRSSKAVFAGLTLLVGPAVAQVPMPVPPPPPAPPASMMPAPQGASPAQPAPMPAPQAATPLVPPVLAPPVVAPPVVAPGIPAASPDAIDPQVTTLFNQAIAAHKALSAMTATIVVSTIGTGTSFRQTVNFAYQKPNEAKVIVAGPSGPLVQFVSNGKTLTLYAFHDKKYRTDPVPAGVNIIPTILAQSRSLLARLIGQPEALNDLLAQPGVTASLGSAGIVSGVPTDTVNATLPTPDGGKVQFEFALGTADHLLRRVIQTAPVSKNGTPQTLVHTETITVLNADLAPTAADFAFTPPAGAKKIAVTAPKAAQSPPPMHDPRLMPGAKPFPVAAKDLSGKLLSLAQYKGKVVLMDFWATWCGPCVGEMPNVIAAYKKYHAQGFDIVGVSLDQSRPALTAFIALHKMPWRQVFDGKYWSSAVPREYGVQAIPFGLLIGRDGRIAAVDVRGPALIAAIQAALAK